MTPDEILDQIGRLRAANNIAWMKLLKLAFKHAPEEAKSAMREISQYDSAITELTRRLSE